VQEDTALDATKFKKMLNAIKHLFLREKRN